MLIEADSNKDGQLSFLEWFEWLSPESSTSVKVPAEWSGYADDPMVLALEDVLRQSVCTLRIVARITEDPSVLCAAYVAGGIIAGVLDVTELAPPRPGDSKKASVTRSMLARLSPSTRELVIYALALESASTFDAAIIRPGAAPSSSGSSNSNAMFLLPETSTAKPIRRTYSSAVDQPFYVSNSTWLQEKTATLTAATAARSAAPINSGVLKSEGVSIPITNMRRPRYLSQMRPSSLSTPVKVTELPQEDNADILLKLDVDLASIPVLAAPSIGDEEEHSKQPATTTPALSNVLHELIIPPDDIIPFEESKTKITVAGTINRIEAELVLPLPSLSEGEVLSHIESLADQPIQESGTTSVSVVSKNTTQHGLAYRGLIDKGGAAVSANIQPRDAFVDTNNLNLLLNQVSALMDEAVQLRGAIPDLSDAQAGKMRALLLQKSNQRKDILGLAMALRSCQLLHMQTKRYSVNAPSEGAPYKGNGYAVRVRSSARSAKMSLAARQQLALETLQLWSPLSFQLGLSSQIPELEVYSYVHLFPRSFGSFISWYSMFRPLARQLIGCFREDIERMVRGDPLILATCAKVTIQSRLKTPPSAFKKMLKGAKLRSQLFDILGSEQGNFHSPSTAAAAAVVGTPSTPIDVEKISVHRVYTLISELSKWAEDKTRFKDYVSYPKPSGYQSIHTSLQHKDTGIFLEIQIRSERMHRAADATHNNYKALLLGDGQQRTKTTTTE
eukprot:gene27083-35797_t